MVAEVRAAGRRNIEEEGGMAAAIIQSHPRYTNIKIPHGCSDVLSG
jgi:hypothetical protein